MAPACLVTSAAHAATLAAEVTSQVAVLIPSSASCCRVSILDDKAINVPEVLEHHVTLPQYTWLCEASRHFHVACSLSFA